MAHLHSILVVDDDRATRDAMATLLRENGFTARTARDGREALQRLRTGPAPCLLLLDMMMPRMTGWEFLELHRENRRLAAVPLVLVTGWLDTEVAQAKAMVAKPVDPAKLLRTLRRVLEDEKGKGGPVSRRRRPRPPAKKKPGGRRLAESA